MGKIWIIIQREYLTRVRRKAFYITTLLAPLGFLLLMVFSVLISTYNKGKLDIAIVDESGLFKDVPIADSEDGSIYFHRVSDSYTSLSAELPKEDKDKAKYQGIVFIPADFDVNRPAIAYRYVKRPGLNNKVFIEQRMNDAFQEMRMKMLNINPAERKEMQKKIVLSYDSLVDEKEKSGYAIAASGLGMLMGFAIYISLFFYGTMIMKGVQEEKTNRVVEILTSSVKPFQLLMGKIIGVGAVGLTQFVLWVLLITLINIAVLPVLGISLNHYAAPQPNVPADFDPDSMASVMQGLSSLPFMQIAIFFPLFFLGGFLLYGSLFAAVGAAMGEDGDQQSLMVPITVPIIVSILIAINVINNPDSSLGFWGSIIPFTSPVVMSAMLPFVHDWKQIALSLTLLIAGFLFTAFIAGRIYRVGILMYGKKIKLRELVKWVFSKG